MSQAAPDREPAPDLQTFALLLRRLSGELNRVSRALAHEQGLHPTDVQALVVILDEEGPVTPGLLCERLDLTSGAVTACVDRLERAGHIRRSRASGDRRVVHLHYAQGARAVARAHFAPLARSTQEVMSRFDEGELAVVLRFLGGLNEELAELG